MNFMERNKEKLSFHISLNMSSREYKLQKSTLEDCQNAKEVLKTRKHD